MAVSVRLRRGWREALRYGLLIFASIIALYPVLWVASVAFKTQEEYSLDPVGLPDSLDFTNFSEILGSAEIRGYILNSLIVVGAAVPIVTATAVIAGYALARLWGKRGVVILFVFLMSEFVPLTTVAIPLLLSVNEVGLDNGLLRLILVYSVLTMGFSVLISRAFFRSIPEELREAARLDGASEFKVFTRIMVPLARSAILMIAVISFIVFWNEYFLALVLLNNTGDHTLPLGLTALQGKYVTDWPKLAAALLVSSIPTFVLYATFQGKIAGQLSRGAARQ